MINKWNVVEMMMNPLHTDGFMKHFGCQSPPLASGYRKGHSFTYSMNGICKSSKSVCWSIFWASIPTRTAFDLSKAWFIDLMPVLHLHTQHPSLTVVKGVDTHSGTQITNVSFNLAGFPLVLFYTGLKSSGCVWNAGCDQLWCVGTGNDKEKEIKNIWSCP